MKKKILKKDIESAVRKCFDSSLVSIRPYSKGYINRMFELKLTTPRKELLLRLFNEKWKAKKEAFIYRKIAALDIPIPEIYCIDDSGKILPYAYLIMSKIKGRQIDENYRKYKNKRLFGQAGEILAKLHTIKFQKFGWIIGNKIKPAFKRWQDFVWHDIGLKFARLKNIRKVMNIKDEIEHYLSNYSYLLDVNKKPSLLHKDYHCSHILTDKNNITGIIDVEWAIAGHNENDFIKMELWALNRLKNLREAFFRGYLKYGSISDDYLARKKLYELWHWISMVNISYEIKNRGWLNYNIKALEKFLKNEHH